MKNPTTGRNLFVFSVLLSAAAAASLSVPGALASTSSEPRKPVDLREAPAVLAPKRGAAPSDPAAAPALVDERWTVSLATFRGGAGQAALAESSLERIRAVPMLREAFITPRGEATVISIGRFADPASPDAQDLLRRVRALEVQGSRPFAQAVLSPPPGGQLGSRPEYNLLKAREQFGKSARVTLQVGIYGRDDLDRPAESDLAEARANAENAAAQLRREGELAFYYHGPRRSTVTVGVFSETDLGDPQKGVPMAPELAQLKKRFPNNLYNGQGIRERVPGLTEPRMQESQTVRIPER
jgi:hypothetical protein